MEFSFSIGDNVYEIPEVINLSLFERAIAWDITDIKNLRPFVSTITECPLHKLSLLDDETFEIILGMCMSRLEFNEIEIKRNIGQYQLKPFEEFTFGEFMDIDLLLVGGGIQSNAVEITKLLYGMSTTVASNIDVNRVWGTLIELSKWRENVYRDYDEFFQLSEIQSDEDPEPMETGALQYMWYEAVVVLADDKFLNINKVIKRPYKEALNFLTYKKHQVDKLKLEQLRRKNDLQRRTK